MIRLNCELASRAIQNCDYVPGGGRGRLPQFVCSGKLQPLKFKSKSQLE